MKLLLDTHVFLWWRLDSPRLKGEARRAIAAAETAHVSAASAWEVAIKVALGHLPSVKHGGIRPVPTLASVAHCAGCRELPGPPRRPAHGDLVV